MVRQEGSELTSILNVEDNNCISDGLRSAIPLRQGLLDACRVISVHGETTCFARLTSLWSSQPVVGYAGEGGLRAQGEEEEARRRRRGGGGEEEEVRRRKQEKREGSGERVGGQAREEKARRGQTTSINRKNQSQKLERTIP